MGGWVILSQSRHENFSRAALRRLRARRRSYRDHGDADHDGKLNDVDPQAWLADLLARIAETSQNRLHELLPWEWKTALAKSAA